MPLATRVTNCAFGEDVSFMLFSDINRDPTCPCPLSDTPAFEFNSECVDKPIVLSVLPLILHRQHSF